MKKNIAACPYCKKRVSAQDCKAGADIPFIIKYKSSRIPDEQGMQGTWECPACGEPMCAVHKLFPRKGFAWEKPKISITGW